MSAPPRLPPKPSSSSSSSPLPLQSHSPHTTRPLPSVPVPSTNYPPRREVDDHVVPIEPFSPSPRTPTTTRRTSTSGLTPTRQGLGSRREGGQEFLDDSPRNKTSSPRRAAVSGRSTSIDLQQSQHSLLLQFDQDNENEHDTRYSINMGREEQEEEQPLMLPFNYPSTREPRPPLLPSKEKRPFRSLLKQSKWIIISAGVVLSLIGWLSWKIVTRGSGFSRASGEEGLTGSLEDQMLKLISTRFEKEYNGTEAVGLINIALEDNEEEDLGKDGDVVKMENGEEFVYRNSFGGTFVKSSSSLRAQAQSDTPSLAEEWDYESMTISGVNLGGWLTLEPFITPALFEPFLNSTTPAVDEYTLSQHLLEQGGEEHLSKVLENHYDTFITEKDFAEIAGAGLNWVRIPLPFWSVAKWPGEPFLERTSWKYFLKALKWSRKYGLRVNLDLHSVPGSQNGWNHSGKWGSINWLHSTMGFANAQRSLDTIESLAEVVARPEVAEVVKMFSLLNEPMMNVIGMEPMRSFYVKAYRSIRAQTGYNSGPVIAVHDGFKGTRRWFDFATTASFRDFPSPSAQTNLANASERAPIKMIGGMDRVAIDAHRYLAFSEPDTRSVRDQVLKPCQKWATEFNKTFNGFGIPVAGEFSVAVNDCGRFLNNVNQGTRLEGTFLNEATGVPLFNASVEAGSCSFWEDYENWSTELKDDLKALAYAQMDTFQNWFYWTWKTSASSETPDRFANPLWSYSLGLERGWIPRNPRLSSGFCYSYAQENRLMTGMPRRRERKTRETMEGWKTGRYLSEDQRLVRNETELDAGRYPWPPEYFNLDPMSAPSSFDASSPKLRVDELPRYSRSAPPVVLPGLAPPTQPTSRLKDVKDVSRLPLQHAAIEGCDYPGTWSSENGTSWSQACLARS